MIQKDKAFPSKNKCVPSQVHTCNIQQSTQWNILISPSSTTLEAKLYYENQEMHTNYSTEIIFTTSSEKYTTLKIFCSKRLLRLARRFIGITLRHGDRLFVLYGKGS